MSNEYRAFKVTVREGVTPAGGKIEVVHGCNGVSHVDLPVKVFYDEDGHVTYAELYPFKKQGCCDGTCTAEDRGSFLYPVSVPVS